jgi:hypothetical protein
MYAIRKSLVGAGWALQMRMVHRQKPHSARPLVTIRFDNSGSNEGKNLNHLVRL